jgi:hypothetical protein
MGGGLFRRRLLTKQRRTTLGQTSARGGSHPREETLGLPDFHGAIGHNNAYQNALRPSVLSIGRRSV